MWQNQLLRNSLGRVCPYLGKQDKTRGAGTCRERDSHTRVPRGTALPPRSAGRWSWRDTHLGWGVSTQARKTSNNKKIIHRRLRWVGLFIFMRYKYPYSKGRLSFKIIPVYPWKGEQVWWWGKTFSRELCHEPRQGIFFMARAPGQAIYYVTSEILWFWVSWLRQK